MGGRSLFAKQKESPPPRPLADVAPLRGALCFIATL